MSVNLLTNQAAVCFNAEVTNQRDLIKVIRDLGYGCSMSRFVLYFNSFPTHTHTLCSPTFLSPVFFFNKRTHTHARTHTHTFTPLPSLSSNLFLKTKNYCSRRTSRDDSREAQQREIRYWRRLLIWGLIFSIPIALLSMILPMTNMVNCMYVCVCVSVCMWFVLFLVVFFNLSFFFHFFFVRKQTLKLQKIDDALNTIMFNELTAVDFVLFVLATPVQFWIGKK